MYLWQQIKNKLDKKVDKVSGKGLSANDFTTLEKNKLQGIETGANNYVHPQTHPSSMITGLPAKLPADGGNADTANKLLHSRSIQMSGMVENNGVALFDGSGDITINTKFRGGEFGKQKGWYKIVSMRGMGVDNADDTIRIVLKVDHMDRYNGGSGILEVSFYLTDDGRVTDAKLCWQYANEIDPQNFKLACCDEPFGDVELWAYSQGEAYHVSVISEGIGCVERPVWDLPNRIVNDPPDSESLPGGCRYITSSFLDIKNSTVANRWEKERNINGMLVDGSKNRVNYGKCYTPSHTDAKIVECPGFQLIEGAEVTVRFMNGSTAKEPTLDVNGTGAHDILNYSTIIGEIGENELVTFRYDSNVWIGSGIRSRPSSTVPKENGEASVGVEDKYARGDHAHPLQKSVSGNAGTATKLKTARSISVSGDMVGSGVAFDGTKDISLPVYRRGCIAGSYVLTTKTWYKFATITVNQGYEDRAITFHVSNKYGESAANDMGILTAHFRTNSNMTLESKHLVWEYALTEINPDDFVLAYKSDVNEVIVELYVRIEDVRKFYHFDVLSEGSRTERKDGRWGLYNGGAVDVIDNSFTQVKSTLATLKNNVSNMLIPMYMGFQTLKGDKEVTLQVKKFIFEDDGRTEWITWEDIGLTKNYADVVVLCQPSYSNAGDIVWIGWERAGTDVGKDKSRFIAMSSGWKNYTGILWVTYFVAGTN